MEVGKDSSAGRGTTASYGTPAISARGLRNATWTGMVPVDDTALAVTDTRGPGRPVVYLNGAYADQRPWRRVIAELGTDYRHITYDERARGKSKRSADYSFEACIRDVDAVLEATGVDRPLLVGWSYGATLAVHWADRNPDRVLGVVSVDGAIPYGLTDEEGRERIRKLFRRMRLVLPLARPAGPGRADDRRPARRGQHRDQRDRRRHRAGPRPRDLPGAVRPGHGCQPRRGPGGDGTGAGLARSGARP